jgi:hypothetical protein
MFCFSAALTPSPRLLRRNTKRELKRGFASLIKLIPLPLGKGKGIKGIGFIKIKGGEVTRKIKLNI